MTTNYNRATTAIGAWIDNNLPHDETLFGAWKAAANAFIAHTTTTTDNTSEQ